jgi:hypothetical protein
LAGSEKYKIPVDLT